MVVGVRWYALNISPISWDFHAQSLEVTQNGAKNKKIQWASEKNGLIGSSWNEDSDNSNNHSLQLIIFFLNTEIEIWYIIKQYKNILLCQKIIYISSEPLFV